MVFVPLGSTEQHGPHLPLDTDTRIACAWADALAARFDGATVAPPLPYGSSGEHQDFAGTISVGREALQVILVELVRSAAETFSRFVLVCGHAGNLDPVERATTQLRAEGHSVTNLFPHWPTGDARFPPLDAHAGRVETSIMLHLAPELVRMERAKAGAIEPIRLLLDQLQRNGVSSVSPNGVLGDPQGANAEEGRLLFDDLVDRSAPLLTES